MDSVPAPGAVLGYLSNGRPIRLIAGGAEEEGGGSSSSQTGQQQPEQSPQLPQQGGEGEQSGSGTEPTDWEAEAKKWKEFSRKHEANAKANAEAAEKLKEIEQAKKTTEQQLTDERDKLTKELNAYKLQELRSSAVTAAGLSADMAQFITAEDAETAKAQAQTLAGHLKPSEPKYQQGYRGGSESAQSSVAAGRELYQQRKKTS